MEIKYEIIPEDLTYYSKETAVGTNFYTFQIIMWTVIILLFLMSDMLMAVLGTFLNDGSVRVDSINVLPRMIVALVLIGISYFALMSVSKRAVRKLGRTVGKNGLFCEHTITLDEGGFTETTHVNRNFQSWDGVEKITETKSYISLQVRAGSPYFIPKRAFSSAEVMNEFIGIAQNYLSTATSPHTPPPPPTFQPQHTA